MLFVHSWVLGDALDVLFVQRGSRGFVNELLFSSHVRKYRRAIALLPASALASAVLLALTKMLKF